MPAPPKKLKLRLRYDSRQQEVIDRCARVFAERGYHGTSIDDLIEATGLARGGLYHYIGSKSELLSRILEDLMAPLLEEAAEVVHGPIKREDEIERHADAIDREAGASGRPADELDPHAGEPDHDVPIRRGPPPPMSAEQRLRALTLVWMEQVESHQDHIVVFLQERRTMEREPTWDKVRRDRDAFEGLLTDVLQEGVDAGEFELADPSLSALALLGMVNHSALWFRADGRLTAEAVADGFCDLLLRGIARD